MSKHYILHSCVNQRRHGLRRMRAHDPRHGPAYGDDFRAARLHGRSPRYLGPRCQGCVTCARCQALHDIVPDGEAASPPDPAPALERAIYSIPIVIPFLSML